jgi:hypothetical protein
MRYNSRWRKPSGITQKNEKKRVSAYETLFFYGR